MMTSLLYSKNDSWILRRNILLGLSLLIAVTAGIFLPEILGIKPIQSEHVSHTLQVQSHRVARQVSSNKIDELIATSKPSSMNTREQYDPQDIGVQTTPMAVSSEVANVGIRARQTISDIRDVSHIQASLEPEVRSPNFAVLSWDDVRKPNIQATLERVLKDSSELLSILSSSEFPRSHFELKSFQSALAPLLNEKASSAAPLVPILEFLDYRDSVVTAALIKEQASRRIKRAWKAISLKPVLDNSLSQKRKQALDTAFKPTFFLTEARFRYDWIGDKRKKLSTPLRASLKGTFTDKDIQSIEWYYSDTPNKKNRARMTGKGERTFTIKRGSDIQRATLIVVATAKDGSQYAKAYKFNKHLEKFALRPVDRFWELQYKLNRPDKRIDQLFLVSQGVRQQHDEPKVQLASQSSALQIGRF